MPDISEADWSEIYRRCRSIYGMGSHFQNLVTSWQPSEAFRAKCAALRDHGMNIPADIEDDLVAIHSKLRKERQSHYYDDVYHAATYILVVPFVTYQRRVLSSEDPGSHPYIHRGQRNSDWLVAPNIMRLPRGRNRDRLKRLGSRSSPEDRGFREALAPETPRS
jgi:hypothetical protein